MNDQPERECFVVSPIGPADSEIRRRSDQLLNFILRPVLEPRGFVVKRADEDANPGSITSAMISDIISADVVIADLTDQNPNCFYELAVAHAYRRPVIHMIYAQQVMPFDIYDMRAISYRTDDLEAAENARVGLESALTVIDAPGYQQRTPLSDARTLVRAEQSGDPTPELLAAISLELQQLRRVVNQLVATESWPRGHAAPGGTNSMEFNGLVGSSVDPTIRWPERYEKVISVEEYLRTDGAMGVRVRWIPEGSAEPQVTEALLMDLPKWMAGLRRVRLN